MCFLLVSIDPGHRYPLIIAANRDELHDRPARPAAFWTEHPDVIAGRDEQAGGTWLGMNRRGQFACLTNFRDGKTAASNAPSRGDLVLDYLTGEASKAQFTQSLLKHRSRFNGFNLVYGSMYELSHVSNRNQRGEQRLSIGVHGLSNGDLDERWPKVIRGQGLFSRTVEAARQSNVGANLLTDQLLDLLADTQAADDDTLPQTGVGIEREKILSPIFIRTPVYGTRCSTVISVDRDGEVNFVERSFDCRAQPIGDVHERFRLRSESDGRNV